MKKYIVEEEILFERLGPPTISEVATIITNLVYFIYMANKQSIIAEKDDYLTDRLNKFLKSKNKIRSNLFIVKKISNFVPNAYTFGGRVIYITTALKRILTDNEILAILVHEAGHVLKGHVPAKKLFEIISAFGIGRLVRSLIRRLLNEGKLTTAQQTFLLVLIGISQKIAMTFSRRVLEKQFENSADNFTKELGMDNKLLDAFKKVRKEGNKLSTKCDKMCKLIKKIEAGFKGHPSLESRIVKIMNKSKDVQKDVKNPRFLVRKLGKELIK